MLNYWKLWHPPPWKLFSYVFSSQPAIFSPNGAFYRLILQIKKMIEEWNCLPQGPWGIYRRSVRGNPSKSNGEDQRWWIRSIWPCDPDLPTLEFDYGTRKVVKKPYESAQGDCPPHVTKSADLIGLGHACCRLSKTGLVCPNSKTNHCDPVHLS